MIAFCPMSEYYPLSYRAADEADLLELTLLEDTCFRYNQPYRKNLVRYFFSPLGQCLCAYLGNRPVGYILLVFTTHMKTVEINAFGVHPRLRRQGIGKNLLQKACIEATQVGATQISCDVSFKNEATSELLSEAAFIDTFEDPRQLPDPLDGTCLVLRLTEKNAAISTFAARYDVELNVFNSDFFKILKVNS